RQTKPLTPRRFRIWLPSSLFASVFDLCLIRYGLQARKTPQVGDDRLCVASIRRVGWMPDRRGTTLAAKVPESGFRRHQVVKQRDAKVGVS
ncbi:MAG TPA: hypothetical protein VF278_07765, partial [Pirellulales bacterium]